MPSLFDNGDKNTAQRFRDGLKQIAERAFSGEAENIYTAFATAQQHPLLNVAENNSTQVKHAQLGDIEIEISAVWQERRGSNRLLPFQVYLKAPNWSLGATIYLESASESDKWLLLTYPTGSCSDRVLALAGVETLARGNFTFFS